MESKAQPLLFTDIETTGHDPLKRVGDHLVLWHEIIDIAGILVAQGNLSAVDAIQFKVRPEHPERCLPNLVNHYPERVACGEWRDAVPLGYALGRFVTFACQLGTPAILIGQNFFFDWNFLTAAFAWCGIPESEYKKCLDYTRLDTRSMAAQELLQLGEVYDPAEFSIRNGRLLARLGIEPEPEVHEAMNGARKACEVYRKLQYGKLERVLRNASGKDTCWPGCVEQWSPGNPAWGHCAMYALYVNEFLGGEIVFVEAVFPDSASAPHYLNCLNGEDTDFSSSQFGKGTFFRGRKIVTRESVLLLPDNEAERYEIFKRRVSELFRDQGRGVL